MKINFKIYLFFVLCMFLHASEGTSAEGADIFWIWIALFTLALIAITILFVNSRQTIKMQRLHKEMIEKQLEMEQNQNQLLTSMSENIRNIAKQALDHNHINTHNLHPLVHGSENVEDRLLSVTNDLIDFLRLKSKKVEIKHEKFNINNVLNEVSGSISSRFSGQNTELIFDIDNNIPRYLIGDSLHLGQVLDSVLGHVMEQFNAGEVKLRISMFNTFSKKLELQFVFTDTGLGLSSEQLENLFNPYYDEDEARYIGLGLFVANELVTMMNGELSVESTIGKGCTFSLALPFEVENVYEKRMYRLPDKVFIEKKVFIVDTNYHSALAIKKMFAYFKHEVKAISKEEFERNMPNLTSYDIVVINENMFNIRLVEYLHKIKKAKELKVIALNSLIDSHINNFVDDIIDLHLFKPLNQERILEMILNLYDIKLSSSVADEKNGKSNHAKVYQGSILPTRHVTKSHFQEFKGKRILIVEDNTINQKVLTNILSESEMDITIAINGQEAVEIIKDSILKFDLVLMDINMPILDGYTATQMIRLDKRFDLLPVVAFTALVLESEIRKMFNSGINAFLEKPLDVGKLYSAFKMFLSEDDEVEPISKKLVDKTYGKYPGLDIEAGLKHANNNEALYIEILKEFEEAYNHSGDLFVKLVDEHRYEQIKMLCIDIRGLTGSIGASDLHELINEIYQRLMYNKKELIPNYKEKYIFEINNLSKSIKEFIEAESA